MEEKYELNIRSNVGETYLHYTHFNYTETNALAEFIDNSTASFYQNEEKLKSIRSGKLEIIINYDPKTRILTIEDNAFGMNREDFDRAMIAGKVSNVLGRNQFGYGLKTAATWFGKKWTVESTRYGFEEKFSGTIDVDYLLESKKNEISILKEKAKYDEHYTKITIYNVVKEIGSKKIVTEIQKKLQLIYSRDLLSKKIIIRFNSKTLEFKPFEPLVYLDKTYKKDVNFEFTYNNKVYKVSGFVGILSKIDSGFNKAGFSLFRYDRVIVSQYKPLEIFSQTQNAKSKNLYGEFNMEDFEVNQFKSGFDWSSDLEVAFIKNLKEVISDYIKVAALSDKERKKNDDEYKKQIEDDNNKNKLGGVDITAPIDIIVFDPKEEDNNSISGDAKEKNKEDNIKIDEKEIDTKSISVYKQNKEKPQINVYTILMDGESHDVKYCKIEDNYFMYEFKDNNLILNTNHEFIQSINENAKYDVAKFILAFAIANKKALDNVDEEGSISPSFIKNIINKIII